MFYLLSLRLTLHDKHHFVVVIIIIIIIIYINWVNSIYFFYHHHLVLWLFRIKFLLFFKVLTFLYVFSIPTFYIFFIQSTVIARLVPVHCQGSNRSPTIARERAIPDDNLRRQIARLLKQGCPHTACIMILFLCILPNSRTTGPIWMNFFVCVWVTPRMVWILQSSS